MLSLLTIARQLQKSSRETQQKYLQCSWERGEYRSNTPMGKKTSPAATKININDTASTKIILSVVSDRMKTWYNGRKWIFSSGTRASLVEQCSRHGFVLCQCIHTVALVTPQLNNCVRLLKNSLMPHLWPRMDQQNWQKQVKFLLGFLK